MRGPEEPGRKVKQDILRKRAARLAFVPEKKRRGIVLEVVEFLLGQERYALGTAHIRQVQRLKDLTPLPGTAPFVAGVVNRQGEILSVIDLKKLFGLPDRQEAPGGLLIFVAAGKREMGLLADELVGLREIYPESLQTSLMLASAGLGQFILGADPDGLIVLDGTKFFAEEEGTIWKKGQ
jgi:purine-binding chemotaxis protein CheW